MLGDAFRLGSRVFISSAVSRRYGRMRYFGQTRETSWITWNS